jgi:hypothetical protein
VDRVGEDGNAVGEDAAHDFDGREEEVQPKGDADGKGVVVMVVEMAVILRVTVAVSMTLAVCIATLTACETVGLSGAHVGVGIGPLLFVLPHTLSWNLPRRA